TPRSSWPWTPGSTTSTSRPATATPSCGWDHGCPPPPATSFRPPTPGSRAGGSLEAVVRAREEGLATFIGITGHGHQAPATHREALARFPFDTVLSPLNWVLGRDPAYLADYQALVAEVQAQDVGLMIIKTVSRRNWPEGGPVEHGYST